MAIKKKSEQRIKKENYWFRLQHVAAKYKNAIFVNADSVSSKQICMIRYKLRQIDAYMIMGKNVSKCRVYFNPFIRIDPHEGLPHRRQH